jgi:hypothetical protein
VAHVAFTPAAESPTPGARGIVGVAGEGALLHVGMTRGKGGGGREALGKGGAGRHQSEGSGVVAHVAFTQAAVSGAYLVLQLKGHSCISVT